MRQMGGAMTMRFDDEIALTLQDAGLYEATIAETWWIERGPNGGYLAALLLHALIETVGDPRRDPRSLTIHFLEPPASGPCRIVTTVERAGRSVTTLSARLTQGERTCALALAAFAVPRPSYELAEAAMPIVPPPEGLSPFPPAGTLFPRFTTHYDYRWALGDLPFSGSSSSRVGGWIRLTEPRPADAPLLAAFADAWVPCLFPRLAEPIGAPTLDLTIHFRARLPLPAAAPDDFYFCVFSSQLAADGVFDESGEIWSRDGALLAQSRQLALLPTLRVE
jgi:acyl-CoA thioesterase